MKELATVNSGKAHEVWFLFNVFTSSRFLSFLVYAFFLCVMVSPRLPLGELTLRMEDFLLPFALIFSAGLIWHGKNHHSSALTAFVTVYYVYALAISAVLFVFGELGIRAFLYMGKETLFFLQFFLVILWGQKLGGFRSFERFSLVLIVLNVGFGFFQILSGQWYGFYGIGSIGDSASAASGNAYFICLVVAIYLFSSKPGIWLFLLCFSAMLCLIATISRTFVLGALVFVGVLLMFYLAPVIFNLINKGKLPGIFLFFFLAIGLLLPFSSVFHEKIVKLTVLTTRVTERFFKISSAVAVRADKSLEQLEPFTGIYILTGRGKSFPEHLKGTSTLGVDNQYIRNLLEIGVIGSALWFCMIFSLARSFFVNRLTNETVFFAAFLITYLIMGIPLEVFQTARSGSFFWFMSGYLLVKQKNARIAPVLDDLR